MLEVSQNEALACLSSSSGVERRKKERYVDILYEHPDVKSIDCCQHHRSSLTSTRQSLRSLGQA